MEAREFHGRRRLPELWSQPSGCGSLSLPPNPVAAVGTGGLIRRAWVAVAVLFCGRRWARSGHHQVTIEDSNTWCPRAPEEAVHLVREYRHDRKRMAPTAHNIDAVIAVIHQRVDKGEKMCRCGFE